MPPHLSTQFFHFFFWSPQPAQGFVVFFVVLSPHTHRMLEQGFVVFSFTFPSLHFCLHIPKTNRLQTDNSISAGEFLFFLCFMGYGGRGLLFFLCPERTPKSPNFGWNPSPSKTPNLQIQKPIHRTETPNLNHRKPQNQIPKHKAKHQTLYLHKPTKKNPYLIQMKLRCFTPKPAQTPRRTTTTTRWKPLGIYL